MKTQLMKRTAALLLAAAMPLTVHAAALFGGEQETLAAEGAPEVQPLEIQT